VFRAGAKLLLLGFGCVCACGLAECSLRVFGYPGAQERLQRVFDARYGEVPRDSWIWSFAIDPLRHHAVELRGATFALPKPAGETRVLFIGDSATQGAFVSDEENYPRQFERLAAERAPLRARQLRAINAGVWGMTSIDEYHLLADKLLPLQPDRVVIGLFMANDLNMNLGHRERVRAGSPWLRALSNHSALAHFLRLRWLALASRSELLQPLELTLTDARGLRMLSYPEGELATYLRDSALMDRAFDMLGGVLAAFQRLGGAHGFSVCVLLIPSPSRVLGRLAVLHYPQLLSELDARGIHIEPGEVDVDLPTRRVLQVCASLGLACIDPTPRLARLGARAFFPTDEHPTALAHRALAEALLDNP
jgi:hypothetical protein